ncbi:methyltransferase [Tenacibaculum ovolyticum]|uniref:methyltransferase n=1 Tax=Tenacibaculum ovolyticum TaxID=104270 RepID=UPI001EEF28D3|nr:methyltransferase [Tenacibaculum ovolyticum]
MKRLIKKIIEPIFKKLFFKYYSKSRKYAYKGISVNIHPEVFPPHFTISTKILLDFLEGKDLKDKTLLELGCGSGIISLFCASKRAEVTASDINNIALKNLKEASIANGLPIEVIHSNLFDTISKTHFDYIIINPPYYPKTPKNIKEQAWFCGENFEYFERLFKQLATEINFENIFMILSEDCNMLKIKNIALVNKLQLSCVLEKSVFLEKNFIYKINNSPL